MKLPALNRNIALLAIVGVSLLIGLELAAYGGLFEKTPHPAQQQLFLPGLPDKTSQVSQSQVVSGTNEGLLRVLPLVVIVAIVVFVGAAVLIFLQTGKMKKSSRDKKRLQDLQDIASVMEKYYQQHGHYPMSATYDSQYYTAINILTEWSSYNFPPAEEMRALNPSWPLSDPNLTPSATNQEGNYLYYPHHFGQRFSLYAQLEAPTQHPVPDYNAIDKLPPTTAKYNYRLNGIDHHTEPAGAQPGQ